MCPSSRTNEVISTTKEKNGDVPVIPKKLLGHVDNSSPLTKKQKKEECCEGETMVMCLRQNRRSRNSGGNTLSRIFCSCLLFLASSCSGVAQEKPTALDLLRQAEAGSPELAQSIAQTFTSTELRGGTAAKGHLSSFFFAIEA